MKVVAGAFAPHFESVRNAPVGARERRLTDGCPPSLRHLSCNVIARARPFLVLARGRSSARDSIGAPNQSNPSQNPRSDSKLDPLIKQPYSREMDLTHR